MVLIVLTTRDLKEKERLELVSLFKEATDWEWQKHINKKIDDFSGVLIISLLDKFGIRWFHEQKLREEDKTIVISKKIKKVPRSVLGLVISIIATIPSGCRNLDEFLEKCAQCCLLMRCRC